MLAAAITKTFGEFQTHDVIDGAPEEQMRFATCAGGYIVGVGADSRNT